MIIPFNAIGVWFEPKKIGGKWRVLIHDNGKDCLFDSATYTKEEAHKLAENQNTKIFMKGVRKNERAQV